MTAVTKSQVRVPKLDLTQKDAPTSSRTSADPKSKAAVAKLPAAAEGPAILRETAKAASEQPAKAGAKIADEPQVERGAGLVAAAAGSDDTPIEVPPPSDETGIITDRRKFHGRIIDETLVPPRIEVDLEAEVRELEDTIQYPIGPFEPQTQVEDVPATGIIGDTDRRRFHGRDILEAVRLLIDGLDG